jgi:hypothetical protein
VSPGRHLAILGSCALARINPVRERHFYLVTAAELDWCDARNVSLGGKLHAVASAQFRSRGLSDLAGELLASLTVRDATYGVQHASVLAHQFALTSERVRLEVKLGDDPRSRLHAFSCRATGLGGRPIGEMKLSLMPLSAAQERSTPYAASAP